VKPKSIVYDIGGNIFIAKKLAKRSCNVIAKLKNEGMIATFNQNKADSLEGNIIIDTKMGNIFE